MSEGDRAHSPNHGRGMFRRVSAVLLVLVIVLAGMAYWLDLDERLGIGPPDPGRGPAAVEPPAGLDLPDPGTAPPVAARLPGGRVDGAAVRRALRGLASDRRLGRRVSVMVGDLAGRPAYARGPDLVTPASTMKLLTCLAALEALGPERRFATTTVVSGRRLTLVGGGDPLLAGQPPADAYPARADLVTLARRTARALTDQRRTRVRLGYDDTLFTGPSSSPEWEPSYLPDHVVSPISALLVDQGRQSADTALRSEDPSRAAATAFAAQLRLRGIKVLGRPGPATAPSEADAVASVLSAEVVEIVQHVLESSDNEAAEVLARHVALAEGEPGSFGGASRAIRAVATRLGVPLEKAAVKDGSGLARTDRLRPRSLLATLAVAADPAHPSLAGLLGGLPVAGFSGSLSFRFTDDAEEGLGRVRAKTGTLTGVHGLAGVVTGRDGSVMTFVAIADRVKVQNTLFARDRLDELGAALAACRCADRG